jgi:hypothetical protein
MSRITSRDCSNRCPLAAVPLKPTLKQWQRTLGARRSSDLLRAAGATPEDIESVEMDIRRWSRGSVRIEFSEPGKKPLRLKA